MSKKESEAKPPEQPPAPAPSPVVSIGNGGVFRVDQGESPVIQPFKTATDSET